MKMKMKMKMIKYQEKYFAIIQKFFTNLTGSDFSKIDTFDNVISKISKNKKVNITKCFGELETDLKALYLEYKATSFMFAKEYKCNKVVLGGGTKFFETQLNASLSTILYSDTVLIPDPLMVYVETSRDDVKYIYVEITKTVYTLLQLKELNDISFTEIPFFIFPSWEKTLEEKDYQTKEESLSLVTDFFKYYVDTGINCPEEIVDYCSNNSSSFRNKILEHKLLFVPNGSAEMKVNQSISLYKEYCRDLRTDIWCEENLQRTNEEIAIISIFERINAQYHLLENASEMHANPLVCVPSQAHYYTLISKMRNSIIAGKHTDNDEDKIIRDALQLPEMSFLSNITLEQMIQLRKTDQNIKFREELRKIIKSFNSMTLADIEYASKDLCNNILSSITQHEQDIKYLKSKFQTKHKKTLLIGSVNLLGTLVPVLAPFVTLSGFGVATKYACDKIQERDELKQKSNSLMGILSLARDKSIKKR